MNHLTVKQEIEEWMEKCLNYTLSDESSIQGNLGFYVTAF